MRIIGEKGITSLTTTTLAQAVGLTTGALFRHFSSWDEIYRHTVHVAFAQMDATFPDPSLPPRTRVFQLAKNRIELFSMNPGLVWLFRSRQAGLTVPKDAALELSTMVQRSRGFLLTAIHQGMQDGSLRKDLTEETTLHLVTGAIQASFGPESLHPIMTKTQKENALKALEGLELVLTPPKTGQAAFTQNPEQRMKEASLNPPQKT